MQQAIHIRFGLPAFLPEVISKSIKKADKMAAWIEATQIAGFEPEEAKKIFQDNHLKHKHCHLEAFPLYGKAHQCV